MQRIFTTTAVGGLVTTVSRLSGRCYTTWLQQPRGVARSFPLSSLANVLSRLQGERGKKVQEFLFDELWRETKRQMRSIEVSTKNEKGWMGFVCQKNEWRVLCFVFVLLLR